MKAIGDHASGGSIPVSISEFSGSSRLARVGLGSAKRLLGICLTALPIRSGRLEVASMLCAQGVAAVSWAFAGIALVQFLSPWLGLGRWWFILRSQGRGLVFLVPVERHDKGESHG